MRFVTGCPKKSSSMSAAWRGNAEQGFCRVYRIIKQQQCNQCYTSKIQTEIDGIPINFIDIDSLKKNKLASGRPQGLADIENLK